MHFFFSGASLYAKEWLDAKDIHRRNNKWIGCFYSGKTNTAVIELRRDCYRAGKFMQYYSCYNLGLIYAKVKKFKESKVLQRALSLNPDSLRFKLDDSKQAAASR